MADEEQNETPVEESQESADTQMDEQESGQEPSSHVKVPEEFQQKVGEMLSSCDSMACLDYLQSAISDKRMEMMKASEGEDDPAGKKLSTPKEFSSDDMPS